MSTDTTDYDLRELPAYDTPLWLAAFVRDEVRPFLHQHRQSALEALSCWRAEYTAHDAFLRHLAALAENSTTHAGSSQAPAPWAYNGPPLDLPLPPTPNRNWSCDQCMVVLLAVHDETRDPRDRLIPTDAGLFTALCCRVHQLTEEQLPDLRAMLRTASDGLCVAAVDADGETPPAQPDTARVESIGSETLPTPVPADHQHSQAVARTGDERPETPPPDGVHRPESLSGSPRPDGPVPPRALWLNGRQFTIGTHRSHRSWLLLAYFWNRSSATYEELQDFSSNSPGVPETPWSTPVGDSAVASAVNRFNNEVPRELPWRLRTESRCVTKIIS